MSSVFKPAVFLAALEQGLITPSTLLPDEPLTYARRAPVPPTAAPLTTRLSHAVSKIQAAASALSTLPIHTPLFGHQSAAAAHSTHSTQQGRKDRAGTSAESDGALRAAPVVDGKRAEEIVGAQPAEGRGDGRTREGAGMGVPAVAPRPRDDLERARAFLLADPEAGGEWTCMSASCPLSLTSPVPPARPAQRPAARRQGSARRRLHRQLACIGTPPAGSGAGFDDGGSPARQSTGQSTVGLTRWGWGRAQADVGEGRLSVEPTGGGSVRLREPGSSGWGWPLWGAPRQAGMVAASLASVTTSGGAIAVCYVRWHWIAWCCRPLCASDHEHR